MFGKLKEKLGLGGEQPVVIGAPAEGEAVAISEVSDPTFGEEILGKGVAILPSRGRIVSPVDGKVETIFETGHAVSLLSDAGTELLIHVGLDTIKLRGQYFKACCSNGDRVTKGDLLIEFDIAGITGAGYDVITPVVVCNSAEYAQFEGTVGKHVTELDELIQIKK